MKNKVFFKTVDTKCISLLVEMELIRKKFLMCGFKETGFKNAELVVYGTCAFKKELENNCMDEIENIMRKKELIVYGCLVGINRKRLTDVYGGPCFTTREKDKLFTYIEKRGVGTHSAQNNEIMKFFEKAARLFFEYAKRAIPVKTTWKVINAINVNNNLLLNNKFVRFAAPYFVVVSEGCVQNCSFCAIKVARGNIRSVHIEEIKNNMLKAYKLGYRNFIFAGQNVGAYGMDCNKTLIDLIESVVEDIPPVRISLNVFDPHFFLKYFDDMRKFYKQGIIYEVCAPLQSGSERIIKLMNRNYDVALIVEKMRELKKINDKIEIATEFIIGFPGETDYDFKLTMDAIKSCKSVCSRIQCYSYSNMPCTDASGFHQVPDNIKKRRFNLANACVGRKK